MLSPAFAAIIASESFDYTTTRWNSSIPGNFNGGTGWGATWQIDLNPPGGHGNGQVAIFGTSEYTPYSPQMAYAAGHGAILSRTLSVVLDNSVGKKYYYCADIYTPVLADTSVYVGLGGFDIGIESQAGKPGELIMSAPDGTSNWGDAKPEQLTNLYGEWHRIMAEVEFVDGGSIFRAWVDASTDTAPSMTINSTSTDFEVSQFTIAHWGDGGYSLADTVILGTDFRDIGLSVPEPGSLALLSFFGLLLLLFRKNQPPG